MREDTQFTKSNAKEMGKKGLDARWGSRYELLLELSKLTTNEEQKLYLTWRTTHLKVFLDILRRKLNNKLK